MVTYSYFFRPQHKIVYEVNFTNDSAKYYRVNSNCNENSQLREWSEFSDEYYKELDEISFQDFQDLRQNCSKLG